MSTEKDKPEACRPSKTFTDTA